MNMLLKSILFISCLVAGISGHGRLLDPPARSSAWREDPVRFPMFYDDNQMFCGGFFTQWTTHKGKCGICGDEYGKELFTKGGADYRGFIVRSYTSGELIQITVEVTANHLGYFEFRLCNTDKLGGQDASQECLDKTIIGDKFGKKRFNIGTQLGKVRFQLRLPSGFVCNHCVFQWKYNAGNSWNVDPVTQKGCVGCGPQEQFYGCSDISIKPKSKRSELTPISGYISERKLQDQDQYGEESSVKVPEKILKKLVSELKRLREMESRFIQREVEVNRREENGEFEERSEPIGDENESNNKRDAIIFPNDQSREKIAPPYEAEIR